MRAHRARPVPDGGPEPVGHDGTGEPGRGHLRAAPHPGAAAHPAQRRAPLRRGKPGQQVDDGMPALVIGAYVQPIRQV
jgi:hypothetical protein